MKLLIATVVMVTGFAAFGEELDKEQINVAERAKEVLPGAIVMRKNEKTGVVEVAHLKKEISMKQLSEAATKGMKFVPVAPEKEYSQDQFAELNADNSRESWYFAYGYRGYYGYGYGAYYGGYYPYYGYGSYYYPSYGYAGAYYAYAPYYGYSYAGYAYSYYRPCWY